MNLCSLILSRIEISEGVNNFTETWEIIPRILIYCSYYVDLEEKKAKTFGL